jgi:Flp pilus assembly protein TadD
MTDTGAAGALSELAAGTRTLAEIEGLTAAEAYSIADFGWMLLEQGRADAAALVFETLALSNPVHGYFHALHGAALQRSGARALALEAYSRALAVDPNETGALVNRAELLIGRAEPGDLDEVATLLGRALSLDPTATRPETRRARALVEALGHAADG